MGTVQFRGTEAVIEAYQFNKVGPWALCCGRELLFSWEETDLQQGSQFLEEVLKHMHKGHSAAEYQLRLYREVPEKGIVNTTPWNYSFKFRLYSDGEYDEKNPFFAKTDAIMNRLTAIEQRMSEEEEGEPESAVMGFINGIIGKPEVQNFLLQKVFGLVNKIFPSDRPAAAAASMGATEPGATAQEGPSTAQLYGALSVDERQKMDWAVHVLLNDPQIGTHLLKLATIYQDEPAKYEMLCKL